jgi:hypothetical protein
MVVEERELRHHLDFERRVHARDALPGAEIELVVVCEASQDAARKQFTSFEEIVSRMGAVSLDAIPAAFMVDLDAIAEGLIDLELFDHIEGSVVGELEQP